MPSKARDSRVDLVRGLSLLFIFVDHIPYNLLSQVTLHNFGFCDAAELFVILAGFSATTAYTRVFERDGLRVGLAKVLFRCLKIYGVQVLLLMLTWVLVDEWTRYHGMQSLILGPMLRDGWRGAMRGVTLRALPAYLDILPLYIVLLATFPLIRFGMQRSASATVGASVLIYAAANVFRWNLPNVVDLADAAHWYFDPFTWQLVFVLGCWLAATTRRRLPIITSPPPLLVAACWTYALLAFLALDAWKLWPSPFGPDFSATSPTLSIFGNEPKTFVSPWRLMNVLAWTYLVLTSRRMIGLAEARVLRPVVACGRHSLDIFAVGCVLALFGRLIFRTYGVTMSTQVLVNAIGLGTMLVLGVVLDRRRTARAGGGHGRGCADASGAVE